MLKFIGLWLILSLFCKVSAGAQADADTALLHYQKGEFAAAADLYLQLIEKNPSHASLYHNLGSALYRNGELGAAVAAYLRALELRPRDPDMRYNLKFLLAQSADKLEAQLPPQSWWQRLLIADHFSAKELFYGSALVLCLGLITGTWLLQRRESRLLLFSTLLSFGLIGIYMSLNLIYKLEGRPDWGAVKVQELAVYSSPTEKNAVMIFRLHQGAPVAILEEAGAWLKIGLSDQKTGWVQRDQLVVFGAETQIYQRSVPQAAGNAKAALP